MKAASSARRQPDTGLAVALGALVLQAAGVRGWIRPTSSLTSLLSAGVTSRQHGRRQWLAATASFTSSSSSTLPGDKDGAFDVTVVYSTKFLDHKCRGYHPEQPTRVSVPATALQSLKRVRMTTPTALENPQIFQQTVEWIEKVHTPSHVQSIRERCERGGGEVDYDTYLNQYSFDTCVLASSAWIDALTTLRQTGKPAFALTRPPGHHAVPDKAMGFCIFNHAAVAARYGLDALGLQRIAILDWDVHYGNGVADCLSSEPRVRYCSIHQEDIFPGTGLADERGPLGNLLHLPIPAYTDMKQYRPIFETQAIPFLRDFDPEVLIVCAGYDTLADDDIAQVCMGPHDYVVLSQILKDTFGASKIMFGLEGGYDPAGVAEAIKYTLQPFMTPTP